MKVYRQRLLFDAPPKMMAARVRYKISTELTLKLTNLVYSLAKTII